jgi:hypothetical protein
MNGIKQIFLEVFGDRLDALEKNYTKLDLNIKQTETILNDTDSTRI